MCIKNIGQLKSFKLQNTNQINSSRELNTKLYSGIDVEKAIKGLKKNIDIEENLNNIINNGKCFSNFKGGKIFKNWEKKLPSVTKHDKKILYKEWDIKHYTPGKNRGPERIVTGDDSSVWYTKDHYKTFKRIK
jgi:guanyl-specific ribonuclease Sa